MLQLRRNLLGATARIRPSQINKYVYSKFIFFLIYIGNLRDSGGDKNKAIRGNRKFYPKIHIESQGFQIDKMIMKKKKEQSLRSQTS